MKAITVCQPFAHRQCLSVGDRHRIAIENRTWFERFDAPLAIHAGKSRDWMDDGDEQLYPGLVFGAVIGVVQRAIMMPVDRVPQDWRRDPNYNGPYCILLCGVQRLSVPAPCRGYNKFWLLPADVESLVMAQLREAA